MNRGFQKSLSLLIKPVSANCNLACHYCFYLSKQELYPGKRRMSIKLLKRLISQSLAIADEVWICWQGGEPALMGLDFYLKVVEIEEHYRKRGQRVYNAFQTNGLLLNERWAMFFRDNSFLVGISIDGPAEIHDSYRVTPQGKPTHGLVLEKIKLLQKYNVQFNTLTVLTDKNGDKAQILFKFFQDLGINYMQFIPCLELNEKKDGLADFSLDAGTYADFLCTMFDKWYNNGEPFCYIREYEEWLIKYIYGVHPSCAFTPSCTGALVIEYNGDVYPCDFFVEPRWLLGNINEVSLGYILNNSNLYREFKLRKKDLDKRCLNCPWLKFCWGGCCKFRWNERGKPIKYSYYCSSYQRFFKYSYDKFIHLKEELKSK